VALICARHSLRVRLHRWLWRRPMHGGVPDQSLTSSYSDSDALEICPLSTWLYPSLSRRPNAKPDASPSLVPDKNGRKCEDRRRREFKLKLVCAQLRLNLYSIQSRACIPTSNMAIVTTTKKDPLYKYNPEMIRIKNELKTIALVRFTKDSLSPLDREEAQWQDRSRSSA
jgi:hypothetical protein